MRYFEGWLCLTLADKLADIEVYASDRQETVVQIASRWLSMGKRDRLVPRGVLPPERRLFESDVNLLLIIWPSKEMAPMLRRACM
jgi:hypothetical protein